MKKLFVLLLFFVPISLAYGTLIFDFNFDNYTESEEFPATDGVTFGQYGSTGHIQDATPIVGMSGLMLQVAGTITFSSALPSSSIITISWDFAIIDFDTDQSNNVLLSIFGGEANTYVASLLFYSSGEVHDEYGRPLDPQATFTIGSANHFTFTANQTTGYYELWMDDRLLASGMSDDAGGTMLEFGTSTSQPTWHTYAIDNFKWEVTSTIPEPATVGLLLLGGGVLALRRKRITR